MSSNVTRGLTILVLVLAIAGCGGAEDRKVRYLEKGEKYFAAGNFEKARVEFRNALQIAPNDASARYQVGRVAEKLNNPREAVSHYQAALDADSRHAAARAALARLFLLGGLADKALELVDPGLALTPDDAQLLTVRGGVRAQRGNVEGAFEDAEAAVKLAPGDEYAIALLASLYRQSARSDKAIEIVRAGIEQAPTSVDLRVVLADLEMAHRRKDEAEAQLRKVIELQPGELPHRYRLARFFLMDENVDAAERTMREAVAANPESVEARIALADLLAAHRGFERAEEALKKFADEEDDASEGARLKLALGRFYEANGKQDAAEATYQEIIGAQKLKPHGLAARTRLAALRMQKNDSDAAAKLVDEVLAENPRDQDALILRGNMALARGDASAAIADLRAVLRDQPNAVAVKRALARAHLQNNETALAEETLRSAVQTNPTDRAVRLELAQVLAQTGRAEQARPLLEQLVAEKPDEPVVLETLFRVQASLHDFAAARATAETAQRVRPDLPIGAYLEGAVSEAEKKLDAAAVAYERALALQPSAAEPLTALVRIELARKQPDRALARVEKALATQPDHAIAHNLKGELLTARGDTAGAIASFDAAISNAPQWWTPYRGLAMAQLAGKRTDAALDALERGHRATGAVALGTDLAGLYERLARPDDAIRIYEQMASRDPGSLALANNLAMLLVSYRSDQASLDQAQQLVGKLHNTSDPAILNTRGWVKFKRGEYQESVSLLQQAVEKSPESPLMRYHLGMAQLRTGDHASAQQNLEAAIASGKEFHGVKEAQAALAEIKRAG